MDRQTLALYAEQLEAWEKLALIKQIADHAIKSDQFYVSTLEYNSNAAKEELTLLAIATLLRD